MPKKEKKENPQLDLKLKESPLNFIAKIKERFELSRAKWDIRRYTKSSWVWFTIVLSISLVATQIYTILENFEYLPQQIPLFQIYVDANQTLTTTEIIYLAPIISVLTIVVGIIFSNKYYNKERNPSNTLLWAMFLGNLFITMAVIRLINIY